MRIQRRRSLEGRVIPTGKRFFRVSKLLTEEWGGAQTSLEDALRTGLRHSKLLIQQMMNDGMITGYSSDEKQRHLFGYIKEKPYIVAFYGAHENGGRYSSYITVCAIRQRKIMQRF